ncbi:hypothetical protein GCM10018952_40900 [Streptosporangium vulgare]
MSLDRGVHPDGDGETGPRTGREPPDEIRARTAGDSAHTPAAGPRQPPSPPPSRLPALRGAGFNADSPSRP